MYNVLKCHDVAKHRVLPRIVMVRCDSIGNATDLPPVVSILPHAA
jgi:hypothetical protein